jgi:hypothetical protein
MKIDHMDLDKLKAHPRNARLHDEKNIQAIMRSLQRFGQRTPLVMGSSGYIIKGCGTLEAMKRLGIKVIAVVRAKLTPEEELAYALADNKTTDLSQFDFQGVGSILKDLQGKIDLSETGFADFELEPLLEGNWDPGTPQEMPTSPDAGLVIKVPAADTPLVQEVLSSLAAKYLPPDQKTSPAQALVFLCQLWLKDNRPRPVLVRRNAMPKRIG